jgi:hypothetical protein
MAKEKDLSTYFDGWFDVYSKNVEKLGEMSDWCYNHFSQVKSGRVFWTVIVTKKHMIFSFKYEDDALMFIHVFGEFVYTKQKVTKTVG